MHLCGMDYKYFSPHFCKCNSFGCTTAIKCGNACLGPHSYSLSSGSEHSQFNSPRLVKREGGFPNPGRALIGSNQLWRVNDSPYYRQYLHVIRVIIVFNLSNLRGGGGTGRPAVHWSPTVAYYFLESWIRYIENGNIRLVFYNGSCERMQ